MISVINNTPRKLKLSCLKTFLKKAVEYLDIKYKKKHKEITLLLCEKEFIIELNKKYRDIKEPTDVLTFDMSEKKNIIEGDIVIYLDRVVEDAEYDEENVDKYLAETIIHGLLHLYGEDHGYEEPELEYMYELHQTILDDLALPCDFLID